MKRLIFEISSQYQYLILAKFLESKYTVQWKDLQRLYNYCPTESFWMLINEDGFCEWSEFFPNCKDYELTTVNDILECKTKFLDKLCY